MKPKVVIDVGNSRTKFGLYVPAVADHPAQKLGRWEQFMAVHHGEAIPWKELDKWLSQADQQSILAGSNPEEIGKLLKLWDHSGKRPPRQIRTRHDVPIAIDEAIEQPDRVGIDRLLNGVAAHVLFPSQPVIVIDSGTATTVDVIDASGTFIGGAILPGIELSAIALHSYTALLPRVAVSEMDAEWPSPIGRNTRDAIKSGILWGQIGAVRELIGRYRSILMCKDIPLLLTGGGGPILAREFTEATPIASLAMFGAVLATQG